jgi:hypothetical protein
VSSPSHFALLASVTTAAGFVMTRIGVMTGQLRQRALRRHCPCCGRRLSPRGCERCGV